MQIGTKVVYFGKRTVHGVIADMPCVDLDSLDPELRKVKIQYDKDGRKRYIVVHIDNVEEYEGESGEYTYDDYALLRPKRHYAKG